MSFKLFFKILIGKIYYYITRNKYKKSVIGVDDINLDYDILIKILIWYVVYLFVARILGDIWFVFFSTNENEVIEWGYRYLGLM